MLRSCREVNQNCEITLEIGGMPILLNMQDPSFRQMLALRYAGFVGSPVPPKFEFDIELIAPPANGPDEDVRVQISDDVWRLRRGDFRAHWDPRVGRAHSAVRQPLRYRFRPAHIAYLDSGAEWRFPAAFGGSHSQRPGLSVLGHIGRGQDHNFAARPSRCHIADGRSLVHPPRPCSAGHTLAYISPYGDVFPCVQFPLPSGNVRRQKFIGIWQHSSELNDVRSIRAKDLPVCSTCSHVGTCTRCPGLAYMEGSMRGPSTADCEKWFHRTGIRSANMLRKTERQRSWRDQRRWSTDPNTIGGCIGTVVR